MLEKEQLKKHLEKIASSHNIINKSQNLWKIIGNIWLLYHAITLAHLNFQTEFQSIRTNPINTKKVQRFKG